MQSIDTYIKESILSSTNSGKAAYLKKVMECLDETRYHIEKLPGHKLESIISDRGWNTEINFNKCSKEALIVFKFYDGILFNVGSKMQYPTKYLFENLDACDIELSNIDFSDNSIICCNSSKKHPDVIFADCKNINIKSLPNSDVNRPMELMLLNTTITGITTNGTKNVKVKIFRYGKNDPITDCMMLKDCKFRELSIDESYFCEKNNDAYRANNWSIIAPKTKGQYIANEFNEHIDEILNSNIVAQTSKNELNVNIYVLGANKLMYSDNEKYKYMIK